MPIACSSTPMTNSSYNMRNMSTSSAALPYRHNPGASRTGHHACRNPTKPTEHNSPPSINDITQEMNNPALLGESSTRADGTVSSPDPSPVKTKTKANHTKLTPESGDFVTITSKSNKKCTSFTSTAMKSSLKPSKFSSNNTPKPQEAIPHPHNRNCVLVEISIDFLKDGLSHFGGDNGKKMVHAIQQLILNL